MDDSRQLALVLYDTLAPQGQSVTQAPNALGFRRSNAFVRIVDLSLSGRRLVDVAYFLVASDPAIKSEYRVDFGLFKWLLGTTSENRSHLKKIIRESQRAAIELTGPDVQEDSSIPWGAVPLMGPAYIAGGEFIFELPERLQKAIKNPEATHFLSLKYDFKSLYSKILYDRLQPYMEDGITPWFEVDALRVWLECDKKQTYNLFKHFRNKVLEVAVTEISDVTGLDISMLMQNVPGSKKVGSVRFKWKGGQHSDEQKTALVILRNTYETLRNEFALNQSEFDEIIKNRLTYTDERIQQAIEYTRHQASAGKVRLRAGGYFMKALREGYLIGSLDQQISLQQAAKTEFSAMTEQIKVRREKSAEKEFTAKQKKESALGWEAYRAFDPSIQERLVFEFCKLPTSKLIAKRIDVAIGDLPNHLENEAVSISFGSFVAMQVHKASKAAEGDASLNLFGGK